VDKFLEHSRVYVFCNDDNKEFYTGSADWMQRNFDHRIEVSIPIHDKDIQEELWTMLQIQIRDNCKTRWLGRDNVNEYRDTGAKKKIRSQFEIYDYFRGQLKQ